MAAVVPRISLPKGPELQRTRYTPYAPGFIGADTPGRAQQLQHELNQAPGRRTGHNELATLWAKYPPTVQHTSSRFSPQPASENDLHPSLKTLKRPAHKALAARLAEAAARQKRKQQQRRNANVWTTHLAADVAAVCDEVGLSAATARVLAAAALKGQISANPGVLLSQLVRLLPLEQQLWGPGSLNHVLSTQPQLIQYDPDSLSTNLAAVQQFLGPIKAVSAVKRYPQLLTCTPFRLQSNVNKLQDMLGFASAAAVSALCARQPLLLLSAPDSLQQRWQQLQQLVPEVDRELLGKQLRRSPELLLLRPSTMANKMACLQQLFDVCKPAAAAAAAAIVAAGRSRRTRQTQQPPDTATAATAAGGVEQQTAVGVASCQQAPAAAAVIGQESDFISWNYTESQDEFNLPELPAGLQQEIAAKLAQLKAVTAQLQQRQQRLQLEPQPRYKQQQRQQQQPGSLHLLQRDSTHSTSTHNSSNTRSRSNGSCDARVQHLVLKTPALLALTPQTLQNHVTELQLLLGLQPDDGQLQRMVLLQPGLLTQSPATLANKIQLLQYLTGRTELDIQEMVIRCPAVLTLSVANITNKWRVLQRCISACRAWQQQLKDAANVTIAMTLCYSVTRLQRLEYVVQATRQCLGSSRSDSCHGSGAVRCVSSSSSNNSSSSYRGARSTSKPEAADAGAAQHQKQRQRQQQQHDDQSLQMKLAVVPWRSLVQDSEQAFRKRYPEYKFWLQQTP